MPDRFQRALILLACAAALVTPRVAGAADIPAAPDGVFVRAGFRLTVAQADVRAPRFMCLAPDGTLYVSETGQGRIRACRDADGDGYYEETATFVDGYPTVHAMVWHDGWLWFTQSGAIRKGRDTNGDRVADDVQTVIPDGELPEGGNHWFRPLLILNGRLYTGIGDSGNINDEADTDREKLWSYDLDGGDKRPFISGIRNTEKLVVRPGTDEIWGMDHGSDWFGRKVEGRRHGQPITDLNPPDEMNHYVEGGFYGHPFIVGSRLPRYEYLNRRDIGSLAARTIVPEWSGGAHWAPNAMAFYDGDAIPGARGDAFVAYHGSWNRSEKAGYCVTRVRFENGKPWGEQVMARFLDARRVLGRPVDVTPAHDGSLLITDDFGDRVYRLTYVGPAAD